MPKGKLNNPNLPNLKRDPQTPEEKKLYREINNNVRRFWEMGKTKVKSDEELENRLSEFFLICAETDQTPTVEKMVLCTGYTRSGFWDIENGVRQGFSSDTANIIKKAKEFLSAFDADLLIKNKLNPVAYIFRDKNYYGMKDQTETVLTARNPMGEGATEEEIKTRLLEGTEVIDADKAK